MKKLSASRIIGIAYREGEANVLPALPSPVATFRRKHCSDPDAPGIKPSFSLIRNTWALLDHYLGITWSLLTKPSNAQVMDKCCISVSNKEEATVKWSVNAPGPLEGLPELAWHISGAEGRRQTDWMRISDCRPDGIGSLGCMQKEFRIDRLGWDQGRRGGIMIRKYALILFVCRG
jgi:hypothetical protein